MSRRIRFSPFVAAGVFTGMVALAPMARASDVPFVTQTPPSMDVVLTRSVSTADVDGDGDTDVISASFHDDKVAWYENATGNATAWTTHVVITTFDGPRFVSAADVDGDGDTDLLASFFGRVCWFENAAGNGSVWVPRTITTSTSSSESVVPADVDGDGDIDALTASPGTDIVAWHENVAANGSLWATHTVTNRANNVQSAFAADVDGDGDTDALSASVFDDTVAWYENMAGNGSSWVRHVITTLANGADFVVAADVDGDGDQDALSSSFFDSKIAWYENLKGDGSLWATGTISLGALRVDGMWAADVDGDGDVDALSVSESVAGSKGRFLWYENSNGDGSVWTTRTITLDADRAFAVSAADLDGDGDTDVVGGTFSTVEWYRNDSIHASACFVTPPPISTAAAGAVGAFAQDLDGDGDTDAVSASLFDGKVAWYENAADNGFTWTTRTITTAAPDAYSVAGADVDGDGDTDVLSASAGDDKVAWYENTAGNGSTWITRTIATTADGATAVFAADVDGDGDQDALSSSFYDDRVAWYENTAGGSVWITRTIATAADGAHAVFAADMDGDGDTDALSASFYDNKVAWYENTAGNGSAWTTRTIATNASGTVSVFAADVDRDGDGDVLATWHTADTVAWYENTAGNGSAWTTHLISTTAYGAESVFATDMDRDGDTDALAASLVGGAVTWYENSAGDGSVWRPHTLSTTAAGASEVLAADVDGDGDSDVLSTSKQNATLAWYDDRSGQFSLAVTDTAPPSANNGELAAMLRIDAAHLGRPGDHDMELASLGLLLEEAPGDPLTTVEANALIQTLRVYRDANTNGVFEPSDVLVTSVEDMVLATGVQTVAFADGDPNLEVTLAAPQVYFVVVELTANASQQSPNQLRMTHLGQGLLASAGEDRAADIRLRLACPADVSSSIKQAVPVELIGFTVE
jgi:hypothetical protein